MTGAAVQSRSRVSYVLAVAAVAGLEAIWLYALLHTLSEGTRVHVPASLLLVLYVASFVLGLGMKLARRSVRTTKVILWLVWPLAAFLALLALLDRSGGIGDYFGAAMFIIFATAALWPLGARLGTGRMTYETVVTEFQLGLAALAASLLLGYLVGVDQPSAVPLAVVFVGLGLVGVAATRSDDGGGPLFFRQGGTWWGMVLVSVALVLMLGLIAGVLFTPELMQYVGRGIRALWGLVERLLDAIAGLFSSSGGSEMPAPPIAEMPVPQEEQQGFSWGIPEWLRYPLRIAYGVFAGGLLLLAAWRIASQFFDWIRRKTGNGGVEFESLPGAFRVDLRRILRRILAWVSALSPFGRIRRRPADELPGTASVRRLYADMLRWGAESGFPRLPCQTPFEYQQVLCAALPAHQADVASITEGYVRAKYAGRPPTEAELDRLKESRHRLKHRRS